MAHVGLDAGDLFVHAGEHALGRVIRDQGALQPGDVHPQGREALAELVVQLVCQPLALVFLQAQDLARERAPGGLGALQRGGEPLQGAGDRVELADRHGRQRMNAVRILQLDAGNRREHVAQGPERALHVPLHDRQHHGAARRKQHEQAEEVAQGLVLFALGRRDEGRRPGAAGAALDGP